MIPKQTCTVLGRSRAIAVGALLLAIPVCQSSCSLQDRGEKSPADTARQWLAANAIRLDSVEAGHGFVDMQPLKQVVGTSRIVALGEATHGSREFFQLKHRMLEFLVTEMGFNLFGIEATMPEAFDINRYVLTGEGDADKALAGLHFWTWDTEEVRSMIEWMRTYNADPTHSRKVRFYGFDMQFAPRAAKVALAYLRRVDPPQAERAGKELAILASPYTDQEFDGLSEAQKASAATAIDEVLAAFDQRKRAYVSHSSEGEWALARQHARVLSENIEFRREKASASTLRDLAMAENVEWMLQREGPDSKAVIWAHNAHVAISRGAMGWHLRQRFGLGLFVFGFAFERGGFQAIEWPTGTKGGLRSFEVDSAPSGSLDALLTSAGLGIAAIDLRGVPSSGPVAEWFSSPHETREVGAVFSEKWSGLTQRSVARIYDGLLFVDMTTRARPLTNREPRQLLAAPTDTGFEESEPGRPPVGWELPPNLATFDFRASTTEENPYEGRRCAVLSRAPGSHYGEVVGSLSQRLAAKPFRGKRVRLRAATRAVLDGPEIHAWLRLIITRASVLSPPFDTLEGYPVDTDEWRTQEVLTEVPQNAEDITYGLYLVGDGTAWLDAVSLEVVGE
jgi:erythromycin esterase